MARSFVGFTTVALVALGQAVAFAQSAAPDISFTRGARGAVATAIAEEVLVSLTLGSRELDLMVTDGADHVRVVGNLDGTVRLERGRNVQTFDVTRMTRDDVADAQRILAASTAMAAYDTLIASEWGRTARQALPFASAHALVSLLQAQTEPLLAFVARLPRPGEPRLRTARSGPGDCWASYERDVIQYTYQHETCIREASATLDPTRTMWCAYSYNLKTTLAFIWLLDCSGSM